MEDREYTIEDLELLLDNIPYAVWLKDENGRYKYVNSVCLERFGLGRRYVIGKTDKEIMDNNFAYNCHKSDEYVKNTGRGISFEEHSVFNGEEVYYDVYKKAIVRKDSKDKLIGGISKEISVSRNIQNAAIQNLIMISGTERDEDNKKYDGIIINEIKGKIKADDIAVYLYDESCKKMKLYIHQGFNNSVFPDYEINNRIKEFDSDIHTSRIKWTFNGIDMKYIYPIRVNNKMCGSLEIYYRCDMQDYFDDSFIIQACAFLGVIFDNRGVSKHLNNELEKRADIQKMLQMIIDTSIDMYTLIIKVGNEYRWMDINKKCLELTGWSYEELYPKAFDELIHTNDILMFKEYIENNKECKNFVCRLLCKSGKYKVMSLDWSYLSEESILITGKDITNERELLKDKKDLEQAVEVETLKKEFFANLSHEFKTPLNIILSTVQVILAYINSNVDYLSYEKVVKYIKGIEQNSYRLLKLANNMIDITKIDGGFYEVELDNYNIVEVVENIVQSLATYMKDNKRNITFDTMEEEIITACDPEKIERIILNLLSNSMKYTSAGGHIDVGMEVTYDCRNVIIKVRNDGPPINPYDAEKIFNRFTQSENFLTRSVEGSGIGLALVKSLVGLHNGRVYVNTDFKNGTEFCIELPVRKIMNSKVSHVSNKNLNSKVQRYSIEFSDIYTLNQ